MSKKPASLKVHALAKELGVSSKDIVAWCQKEEIPDIVNHLSNVSMGLAETLRGQFRNAGGGSSSAESEPTTAATESGGESASESISATATVAPAKKSGVRKSSRSAADAATPGGGGVTSAPADAAAATPSQDSDAAAGGDEPGRMVAKRAARKVASAPAEPAQPSIAAADSIAVGSAAVGSAAVDSAAATQPATTSSVAAVPAPSTTSGVGPGGTAVSGVSPAPVPVLPTRPASARIPAGLTAKLAPRADAPASTASTAASESPTTATRRVITAPPPPPPSMTDTSGAAPVMNVPKRPTNIGPVGPQLGSREKTKLSGPQVIRVEQADNLPTPPPMRRTGTTGTGGPGAGGFRGGRTGTGGGAGRPEMRGRGGIGASRTGRAGESARQAFGQQDLRERQSRLDAAKGFMSSHRNTGMRSGGVGSGPGQRMERKPGEIQQIHVAEPLTIKELSAATGVKAGDILKKLLLSGTMATINSAIDREKAIEIMMDFEIDLIVDEAKSAADIIEERFKDRARVDERRRAPIVTILGHVDHGKTSLLDRIRSTNIAAGEAGGITQSTRAFSVPVKAGAVDRVVTFIDTPGHEAFTSMRARGAKVTDIVVLVVAAVDGVMPQTIEAINHAKAAGVPIVVAMNKIDRPDATEATIRRVLGQLAEHELNPVDVGRPPPKGIKTERRLVATAFQDCSRMLDYQAELLELKADFGGMARGTVSRGPPRERAAGPVARVMVQRRHA